MTSPAVRCDYESLGQIAQIFGQQADATRQTLRQLQRQKDDLQGGNWIGKAADKFYGEMNSAVLPALSRLLTALEAAQKTTEQISQTMKQAEEDAARVLRGEGTLGALGAAGATFVAPVAAAVGAPSSGTIGGSGVQQGIAAIGAAVGKAARAASGAAVDLGEWVDKAAHAAGVARVQDLINAGDHQAAIDEAIKVYHLEIELSDAKDKKATYDPKLKIDDEHQTPAAGKTDPDRTVWIGPLAFTSPALLAATIGHEAVHVRQAKEGRMFPGSFKGTVLGSQGVALNEIEARDWELDNAVRLGLSQHDINRVKAERQIYYNRLNVDNRKLVDSGKYGPPSGPIFPWQ